MNHRVNWMCSLALVASLASCAPTMQGPNGAYTPKTQTGMGRMLVQVVPAAELNDSTPDTAYVSFPDCLNTVVAVPDVRQLGVQAADEVCRKTDGNVVVGVAGYVVAVGLVGTALLLWIIKLLTGG